MSQIVQVKDYYLKGILAIYVIALTSLYVQVQSLFGDNGVVPVRDFAAKLKSATNSRNPLESYNVVLLAPKIGLSHATLMELMCLLGVAIALSALFLRRLSNAVSFGILWYIYYSMCSVGQGFMSFHGDLLLLEVGFITILLAPLLPTKNPSQADHDHLPFFLLKWVVFRYFVTNVINFYLEGDDSWYKMTAFEISACGIQFPSYLSWNLLNLSKEFLKLYQAYEHTTMLVTPFLFIFDLRYCRAMTFYTLMFMSIINALAFNFGWTDLLIAVCLLSYLQDAPQGKAKKVKQSKVKTFIDIVILLAYVALVTAILIHGFGLKMNNGALSARVMFKPEQFKLIVDHLVPISFAFGIIGLLYAIYSSIVRPARRTSIFKTILYAIVVTLIFFSSFPTLTRFTPGLESKVSALKYTKDLSRAVAPLNLSNNYLILSKVTQYYADGRPELQIQGRGSPDEPTWQQYDFRYRLGNNNKPLPVLIPHVPRIELKMWYAARASLTSNQWLQTLAYRLASNERDVVRGVMDSENAYKAKQVRIVTLKYKYSSSLPGPHTAYWLQPEFHSEYMAPTTLDNLKFAIKSNGVSLTSSSRAQEGAKVKSFDQILTKYLDLVGDYIRSVQPIAVIWSLASLAAVTILIK